MKPIVEFLSTKNAKVNHHAFTKDAPFEHWKEAWWKFKHNQYKFNHDIQRWGWGEINFNISIWSDEKLVVAYKYAENNRLERLCDMIAEEAAKRGWDITTINFNTKDWNDKYKESIE